MLEGDIAEAFFQGVLGEARAGQLLSDEHFTVDGTLLEAWASPEIDDHNEQPSGAGWLHSDWTFRQREESGAVAGGRSIVENIANQYRWSCSYHRLYWRSYLLRTWDSYHHSEPTAKSQLHCQ